MNKKQNQIFRLSVLALMCALCYIGFQFFRIDIPLGGSSTAIHFGNIFCVCSRLDPGRCSRWASRCHRNGVSGPHEPTIRHLSTADNDP